MNKTFNSKAFTLIELLAVILILGVIALIAIPVVQNIIDDSKVGAAKVSAGNYIEAIEKMLSTRAITTENLPDGVYTPLEIESYGVDVKGNKPEIGWITIVDNEIVQALLHIDQYVVEYLNEEVNIKDKNIKYKEPILNGTDPVLKNGLVPVIIKEGGVVVKADINDNWYNYATKEWANAVILVDNTIEYNAGDEISLENINSYFVWIPKYKYKLFDLGDYGSATVTPNDIKKQEIKIAFDLENTTDDEEGECTTPLISSSSGECEVGDYMTHPSFITFNNNGYWVSKFELTGTIDALTVVPGSTLITWVSAVNFFDAMYNYNRDLDSHMIKNTEWGAIFYLSHSKFGANMAGFITGITTEERNSARVAYYTETGQKDSTTRNLSGIFHMGGGIYEYVAGIKEASISAIYETDPRETYGSKYFDIYNSCKLSNYRCRILGDATGELGPFYNKGADGIDNAWYQNRAYFLSEKWFARGAGGIPIRNATIGSMIAFNKTNGPGDDNVGSRMVLGG